MRHAVGSLVLNSSGDVELSIAIPGSWGGL